MTRENRRTSLSLFPVWPVTVSGMMNRVPKKVLLTLGASGVLALGIAVPTAAHGGDRAGHSASDEAVKEQKRTDER